MQDSKIQLQDRSRCDTMTMNTLSENQLCLTMYRQTIFRFYDLLRARLQVFEAEKGR